jgi:RHS repeat-associated protein
VVRSYVVDDAGSPTKLVIPAGEPGAGTYLPTWNGHGDALALYRVESTGLLTLANSYTYDTWGKPTTTPHNGSADLGFRFTYVGEFDVQWDDAFGLGLYYMHARHYSPVLGRFLQPDPDGSETNLFAYTANNPITEMDPDGTCFLLCAVVNAVANTAIYLATTDASEWDAGEIAATAAVGAVTGFTGVGLLSKVAKVGGLAVKAITKVPKAGRGLRTTVANGARGARPTAATVRPINKGERVDDLIDEVKRLTFRDGVEHAIVSYGPGSRAIVRGGRGGMTLPSNVRRVIGHTHSRRTGPSDEDFEMLRRLGQRHSYLIEPGSRYQRFSRKR